MALFHRYAYTVAAERIREGDRVLDVGFGEGYGAEILRAADYLGVELDDAVVAHARARYPGRFERYDGLHLPPGPFDLVVSFQVIEHVRDPDTWLSEIARVARCAMFTTPNRVHRLRPGERPWNRHHVTEFEARDLRALLIRHFSNVTVYGVSGSPEIEAIELNRFARARKLARLDPFGLRYRLPESVDARIRRRLRKPLEVPATFSLSELHHSEAAAQSGIDLLAIAT